MTVHHQGLRGLCLMAVLSMPLAGAQAHEFSAAMEAFAPQARQILADPRVATAVSAQNQQTAGLDEAEILARDQVWRAETAASDQPTIQAVLGNPLSAYLAEAKAATHGLVTEVFVTDARGLNVGQSDVTSDLWQGDEAKFTDVFGKGPDALLIGEIEQDESTQAFQSQLSLPVVDAGGAVIGTATFGLNVELLATQ